jgi:hypothetical protein
VRECLVVAYGAGVDSSAMLVGLQQRDVLPNAVLFADTGGEKQETYAFLPVMDAWLRDHGFPTVTVVRNAVTNYKHWPPYHTLEENCLTNGTLPSVAFGWQMKSCSLKWKAAPQHRWMKTFPQALDCWAAGGKVVRAVGFDASPADQRRSNHAGKIDDPLYSFWYPLQEWGWDRERCKEEIRRAGLPVPPKSACFFARHRSLGKSANSPRTSSAASSSWRPGRSPGCGPSRAFGALAARERGAG